MHILLVTHFFPPNHTGGTENYTHGIAKAFVCRGHTVSVACAETWQSGHTYWNGQDEVDWDGLRIHRVYLNWQRASDPNRVLYESDEVEAWFNNLLRRLRPDVVHVTSAYTLGVGPLRATDAAGLPLVLTLTDFWFMCPRVHLLTRDGKLCDGRVSSSTCRSCLFEGTRLNSFLCVLPSSQLADWIRRALSEMQRLSKQRGLRGLALNVNDRRRVLTEALKLPSAILVPSYFVSRTFMEAGYTLPVLVQGHGIDLTALRSYSGKTASDIVRFAYLGQILRGKGLHVLIQAFLDAGFGQRAVLDIWGNVDADPLYLAELRCLVGSSSSVRFRGRYSPAQIADVLREEDVMVIPSLFHETFSLAIREAFATGTPVVASDAGAMAEVIIHEVNGLLFERNNSNALKQHLQRLAFEPELRRRLSAGVTRVKTVDEEAVELEEVYSKVKLDRTCR